MQIYVLVIDGVFDTGLATVLDAFTTANELARLGDQRAPHFDVRLVGVRRQVTTALGLKVPVHSVRNLTPPDLVVVPAPGCKLPAQLLPALSRADVADAMVVLQQWAAAGSFVAAACIGSFILAEAGLLDGGEATTSWWLAPLFRQRYPRVRLDESRMVIASGQHLTAGAALSHMDMALWIIRRASPALAAMTARYLVVDSRPSQAGYVIPDHLAHSDPVVERFERWARERLAEGFSLDDAATAMATSKRTLARRLQLVLGKSPLAYFQDLRVEQAVHLLKTSQDSVEQIAARVGYADGVTLRNLLRRKLGRGVRELRRHD
ncbi:GlxA family transcriptional regulator [Chitinimonas sp.]|uniref:GlxA family transcriptional regulator n=1 Tax=Chitinimonas sp. TaxID=1934313 RepID=UPI0035B08D90